MYIILALAKILCTYNYKWIGYIGLLIPIKNLLTE